MRNRLQESFDAMVRDHVRELSEAIEAEGRLPVLKLFSDAAENMTALVHTFGSQAPHSLDEATLKARSVRRSLVEDVLRPVAELVESRQVVDHLQKSTARCLHRMEQAAKELPSTVVVDEPPSLYASLPEDPILWKVRKSTKRLSRRLFDRNRTQPWTQTLLPQAHALQVVTQKAPDVMVPLVEELMQTILLSFGHVERDVSQAFHDVLNVERRAGHPTGYFPFDDGSTELVERQDELNTELDERRENVVNDWADAAASLERAAASLRNGAQQLDELKHAGAWTAVEVHLQEAFRTRLDRDDTFMAMPADHTTSPAEHRAWKSLRLYGEGGTEWLGHVAHRFQFLAFLDGRVTAMVEGRHRTIDRIRDEIVVPFRDRHVQAARELDAIAGGMDEALGSAERLEQMADRAAKVIDDILLTGFIRDEVVSELSDIPLTEAAGLLDDVDVYPEFRLHPLIPTGAKRVDVTSEARTVLTKDVVEALSEPLRESLAGCTQVLIARLDDMRAQDREIITIIRFNMGSAVELLTTGDADSAADIRELALKGITRSSDGLEAQSTRLQSAFYESAAHIHRAYQEAGIRLHDRARVERQVDEYILDLRTRFDSGTRGVAATAGRRARYGRIVSLRLFHRARRLAQRLILLGREAVGVGAASGTDRQQTIEALLRVDEALDGVPVVYRRLFSFAPVQDAEMLVGRVADRDAVAAHRARWARGFTQSMVITARPGGGVTSFLNVLGKTVFKDDRVLTISLKNRITHEPDLVAHLSHELGLEGESPDTLREFAANILTAEPTSTVPVVIIEHLELLMMRQIGGMKLFSEMLSFMSQTDSRILWMGTCSDFAWQVFGKSEPSATGLVLHHRLSSINRADLEKLVMGRHRRSGLTIRFHPPNRPSPLLKRRLRQAGKEEEKQAVLREEFFDDLHDRVGPNILMALFYWIRSIEVDETEDAIHLQGFEHFSFGFLASLSFEQTLMLKALLEHFTLTVHEAAAVSWTSFNEARQVFEGLGNALLIEPFTDEAQTSGDAFATVNPDIPYRIRPLLVHPVVEFLRARNIVH